MQKEKRCFQVIPNCTPMQARMNLKTLVAPDQMLLLFPAAGQRQSFPPPAPIAQDIRSLGCGIVSAEPVGEAPAVAHRITAAAGSGTIAREPAVGAAVLQSRHQCVANQRRAADRYPESHYRASHGFLAASEPRARAQLCTATNALGQPYFVRQIWQPCSLIIQVKCGTFAATDRLSAVLARPRKVTP